MCRHFFCALLLSTLVLPIAGIGQEVDENNLETLQASSIVSAKRPSDQSSKAAELIVQQTNQFRRSEDLEKVDPNSHLAKAAQYFANFMAKTDKYGHRADGNRPADRAEKFGYDYCMVSENIAYQYSSEGFTAAELAERFVEGWKKSPGHRKNMLEPAVQETGIGIAQSDKTGYWYAVQMFGRPESASIEFTVANHSDAEIQYTIGERTFPLPPRYTRTHTRCKPTKARFDFPANKGGTQQIKPSDGEDFVVVQKDGQYEVTTE